MNTLALSILERIREIELPCAVGMNGRRLAWMMRSEAVVLALLAVLMAVAPGVGFPAVTVRSLAAPTPVLPLGQLAAVVAARSVTGLIAGLVPARRARRLSLLDAISAT